MYLFDTEGFRVLASEVNDLKFSADEREMFGKSWKQSTEAASRLIQHIASLTPHDVKSPVRLNRVRDLLASEIPLIKIQANVEHNLDEVRRPVLVNLVEFRAVLQIEDSY